MTSPVPPALATYGKRHSDASVAARKRLRATLIIQDDNDALRAVREASQTPALSQTATSEASPPPSTPRDAHDSEIGATISSSSPRARRLANRNARIEDLHSYFTSSAVSLKDKARPKKAIGDVPRAKMEVDAFEQQMELDLSRRPKTTSCAECGMSFRRGAPDDVKLHEKHHRRVLGGVDCSLKPDTVVMRDIEIDEDDDTGCIFWLPGLATGAHGKKATEVLDMIDTELSSTQLQEDVLQDCKLFLLLSTRKRRIIGCAVAGPIMGAHSVVEASGAQKGMLRQGQESSAVVCSSAQTPARVGIHRIWTCRLTRRRGLATHLLDAVSQHFVYGERLDKQQIAFSQPTGAGAALARCWFGAQYGWLVFDC